MSDSIKQDIILEKIKQLKKIDKEVPELIAIINSWEFTLGKERHIHKDHNVYLRMQTLKSLRAELAELRGE